MKELTKEQMISIIDALNRDGADNTVWGIYPVTDGTNTKDLCGYGDKVLERGKYLLVWDTTDEDDRRFNMFYDTLEKVIDRPNISQDDYDTLLSNEDGSTDCVVIFRLTSE